MALLTAYEILKEDLPCWTSHRRNAILAAVTAALMLILIVAALWIGMRVMKNINNS
jgi:hypothetical protein